MGRNRPNGAADMTTKYVNQIVEVMKERGVSFTAFDPGAKTGIVEIAAGHLIAIRTINEDDMVRIKSEELSPPGQTWMVERFAVYPWASEALAFTTLAPIRVIGMLQIHAFNIGANIQYQNAAQVKAFISNNVLMAVGWWNSLSNPHEKDAARHALYKMFKLYINKTDSIP